MKKIKSAEEEVKGRSCVVGKELVFTNTTFSRMSQHGAFFCEEWTPWALLGFGRQTSVLCFRRVKLQSWQADVLL